MTRSFGKQISDRLDYTANLLAERFALDILGMAEDNADFPEKWPLTIPVKKIEPSINCGRVLSIVTDILDGYGLLLQVAQADYMMIDLVNPEEDMQYFFEEEISDIPDAKDVAKLSKKSMNAKMIEIYDDVYSKIQESAQNGWHSIKIDISKPPLNKDLAILKRLFKKLAVKNYIIDENGIAIKDGMKIDLGKISKIKIEWRS